MYYIYKSLCVYILYVYAYINLYIPIWVICGCASASVHTSHAIMGTNLTKAFIASLTMQVPAQHSTRFAFQSL